MRETGWKIEGKTGQRTELSNVRKTGWKIEGMTEETARSKPAQRTAPRTGLRIVLRTRPKPAQRTASRNRHEDREEFLPEDPYADGERSVKPRGQLID